MFGYRITGPQSVERLTPLLPLINLNISWVLRNDLKELQIQESNKSGQVLFFVWETYVERTFKPFHDSAVILNRLHNTVILEDKGNMAFLQLKMKCPVLTTHIALNAADVLRWAEKRWESVGSNSGNSASSTVFSFGNGEAVSPVSPDNDWWVVKASRGNGGKDIWIIHPGNFRDVISNQGMPQGEELVIQRYVHNPLLIQGKKFHYRCYAMILGDMSGHVYQHGYVLRAGLAYDCQRDGTELDLCKHISNLSVNKHIPGHPGQVPCHLATEQPEHYAQIQRIWAEVTTAAEPYLRHQTSRHHFEFYGIDIIVDSAPTPTCWLIEINRLPGLESSVQNRAVEDVFYDTMMLQVLRKTVSPLLQPQVVTEMAAEASSGAENEVVDGWDMVAPPSSGESATTACWKNLFQWKAFTRRHRAEVVL